MLFNLLCVHLWCILLIVVSNSPEFVDKTWVFWVQLGAIYISGALAGMFIYKKIQQK